MGRARLGSRWIAIHRLMVEYAQVNRAIDRPGRRRLDFPRQIDIADAIIGDLRCGVGRAVILLQQFDRNGGRCTKLVVGDAHIDVKFAVLVLVADIAIETANIGRRKIAKAVVVQPLECAIYGEVVIDLLAPLRRTLDTPERSAHRVDLAAVAGIRSQLTVSPNASLMRTPFWYTARP